MSRFRGYIQFQAFLHDCLTVPVFGLTLTIAGEHTLLPLSALMLIQLRDSTNENVVFILIRVIFFFVHLNLDL